MDLNSTPSFSNNTSINYVSWRFFNLDAFKGRTPQVFPPLIQNMSSELLKDTPLEKGHMHSEDLLALLLIISPFKLKSF